MDTNSSHLSAPARSRCSHSPTFSHSASASATSSLHKRKLPSDNHAPPFPSSFSDTPDGALISIDDLESISACGSDFDSDHGEEYDDSSMRTFTASRSENNVPPSATNTKLIAENLVKVEPSEVGKDDGTAGLGNAAATVASNSVPGNVVKEDAVKNIFTENIQSIGAREVGLKRKMDSLYDGCFTNLLIGDILDTYDQTSDANPAILSPNPNEVGPTKRKSRRTKNFCREEDILLVSAWINTSKDAVTGSEQQPGTFWGRIYGYFLNNGGAEVERTQISLKNRWTDINAKCAKFAGFLGQIERRQQSGQTVQGRLVEARKMYASLVGRQFQYEHCWKLLKNECKWTDNLSNNKQQTQIGVSPASPDTMHLREESEPSTNQDRPLGIKASKEQLKSKKGKDGAQGSTSMSVTDQYWEEKMELERAKADRHERALEQHQRQLQLEEKLYEMRVMQTDSSRMNPIEAAYWNNLKLEILTRSGFNL